MRSRLRPAKENHAAGQVSIDAEVDLNLGDDGYFLSARLNVRLPGLERKVAKELTDEAGNCVRTQERHMETLKCGSC